MLTSPLCRILLTVAAAVILVHTTPATAAGIVVGSPLPDLAIAERGELLLQDGEVVYRPWYYPQLPDKVHIVQYMAATKSAGDLNKPFRDRLDTDLGENSFQTTTILNMDDAIWGTGGFVLGELKSSKRKYPRAVLVVDDNGAGIEGWQLQNDSSAVMIVDRQGIVRYFKEGRMSAAETDSTLELIRQYSTRQASRETDQNSPR